MDFAGFLENCDDIVSFAKNYDAVRFRLEYVDSEGELHYYLPDFLVKTPDGRIFIIETKGRVGVNDVLKEKRLVQWCDDVNKKSAKAAVGGIFVGQKTWEKHRPHNFTELVAAFSLDAPKI